VSNRVAPTCPQRTRNLSCPRNDVKCIRPDTVAQKGRYLRTRRRRASLVLLLGLRLHSILLPGFSDERSTRMNPWWPRRSGIDDGALRSGASLRGDGGVECRCCCCCCCCCGVSGRFQPARYQGRRRRRLGRARLSSLVTPRAGDAFHPNPRRRRRYCRHCGAAQHAVVGAARSVSADFRVVLEKRRESRLEGLVSLEGMIIEGKILRR